MAKNHSLNSSSKLNKAFNLSLILLCLILIFIGKFDLIIFRNMSSFITDFFAPISNVFNKPVKELENVIEDVQSATSLRKENLRLKTEIRRLKLFEKKSGILESELIELRKMLNFAPRENKVLITSRVLNISGGTFAKTMLIDAGLKDGILVGQPVISNEGLIGSIINVGSSSSRVLLTIDINSMIPIFLTQSGWPAIAQGQNSSFLKLRFLSSEANPILGEMVETSGHGGKFPSGINVGKVISFSSGDYLIKLSANPQKLRFASVIDVSNKSIEKNKSIGLAPLQDSKKIFNLKGFNKVN
tara:strand:- start:11 stop:913 length:903 start_codon:yes stop_codon:yes gene_type:complete